MKNLNRIIFIGMCGLALLTGCGKKKNSAPNIKPGLGKTLEMINTFDSRRGGISFKTLDRDNHRLVFFYDYGYNGTLDEIGVHSTEGGYSSHNPKIVNQWVPDYEKVKKILSRGKFKPIYTEFKKW